jgi:solute carrier family 25 folate transporter 32
VVRTRLQLQSTGVARYSGVFNCIATVWREEGIRAFYRGIGTNLMRVAPACAITFASYESLLSFLEKLDDKYNPVVQIRGAAV